MRNNKLNKTGHHYIPVNLLKKHKPLIWARIGGGIVGKAKRTGKRSAKWSAFGSTPDRLMLRSCSQRSETMVPVNNRSWPASFSSPCLSPGLSASSLCHTKGLLGGWQGRWVERAAWHFNGGEE